MASDKLLGGGELDLKQMKIINEYLQRLPQYTLKLLALLQSESIVSHLYWLPDEGEKNSLKFFLCSQDTRHIPVLATVMENLLIEERMKTGDEILQMDLMGATDQIFQCDSEERLIFEIIQGDIPEKGPQRNDVLSVTYTGKVFQTGETFSTEIFYTDDPKEFGICATEQNQK